MATIGLVVTTAPAEVAIVPVVETIARAAATIVPAAATIVPAVETIARAAATIVLAVETIARAAVAIIAPVVVVTIARAVAEIGLTSVAVEIIVPVEAGIGRILAAAATASIRVTGSAPRISQIAVRPA